MVLVVAAAAIVTLIIDIASQLIGGAVFIPTSRKVVQRMLAFTQIRKGETVYDLGCGDARLLIKANKRYGARAIGIEISPFIYCLAVICTWIYRADVTLIRGDALNRGYNDADVIFCYLLPDMLQTLVSNLGHLKPNCRIISHQFEIPGWTPSGQITFKNWRGTIHIYKYKP